MRWNRRKHIGRNYGEQTTFEEEYARAAEFVMKYRRAILHIYDSKKREVANRVVFIDDGQILESAPPQEFFSNPKNPRLKEFLSKVLA